MIYKVFYQETKERNPRRETTHALYLDIALKLVALLKKIHLTTSNLSLSCQTNT